MIELSTLLDTAAITALIGAAKPFVMEILSNSGEVFKDLVKDAVSDRIKEALPGKKGWDKAVHSLFALFVAEVRHELVRAGLMEEQCGGYKESLKSFIKDRSVRAMLGQIITGNQRVIWPELAEHWRTLGLDVLPDHFDWSRLALELQRHVETIIESDAELREIIKTRAMKTMAKQSSAGFDLSAYADGVLKRYGVLKIDSLYPDHENRPMFLTRVFVEQHVRSCQEFNPRVHELPMERKKELLKKSTLKEELNEDRINRERERFFQQSPQPVLEVIHDPRQKLIVILGDPGSGKSVLLDHLALQWAESSPLNRSSQPLPLLIELKTYIRNHQEHHCNNLLDYLDHGPGAVSHLDQEILEGLFSQGNAWFLLDGLDEIFDTEQRRQVAGEIVRLTNRFPQARVVVTSRIIGYDLIAPLFRDGGFRHFMLQELNFEQQKSFLNRWHKLAYADPKERQEKNERLLSSIRDITSVSELAENPLLLTLMAILNRYRELPRDRNTLYEEASRILLHQWNAEKALRDDPVLATQSIDLSDKQAMLRQVALTMQSSPKGLAGNAISVKELENILFDYLENQGFENTRSMARRMVQQLRERNYILCLLGADYYAFVHRTFLEYFCASAWVLKYEQGEIGPRLTLDQLREQTFDKYWQDEKWHEVLRLIASRMTSNMCEPLLLPLLDKKDTEYKFRNIFLASSCVAVLRNRKPLKLFSEKIRHELLLLFHFDFPYFYKIWNNEMLQVKEIRQAAVQELARGWKDDPETLIILKTRAQQDGNWAVRQAAVRELARGWKDDPETLIILKTRAQQDGNWAVRQAAVQELARGWKDDPDTLPWLKTRAQQDEQGAVRQAAVRELARGWKDDPETLIILKTRAQQDEQGAVRQAAVQALARGWKDDPETLIILKTRAQQDEDEDVRQAAVQALARGWKDDPEVIWLIKEFEG